MIKPLTLSILMLGCTLFCKAQHNTHTSHPINKELLEKAFEIYKEPSITHRRIKHRDIEPLILKRKDSEKLSVKKLGESVQNRAIYQLSYGHGPIKVMLWSQMHGDESTATMALFDIFNFLEGKNDGFDQVRELLAENTSLYFIPMLNPDGAEKFTRRNAWHIDINRDAVDAVTPEAAILKNTREKLQPTFGFNLHDQHIYHSVARTGKPATISVLAPAVDYNGTINAVRKKSMQVIVGINRLLQQYIPGSVGCYDDSFEPRAFGDNFEKWGTSTILIESGGYKNDPEKQFIRKLNFFVILKALGDIATKNYDQYKIEEYNAIPENSSRLMDLVVKNVIIKDKGKSHTVDIGVKHSESNSAEGYFNSAYIADIGDLSTFDGYEELDATEMTWQKGKLSPKTFNKIDDISRKEAFNLLREGYSAISLNEMPKNRLHHLPLTILYESNLPQNGPDLGNKATFFLYKNGKPKYAIINGYLIALDGTTPEKEYKNRIIR